jgi:hypothetical protein
MRSLIEGNSRYSARFVSSNGTRKKLDSVGLPRRRIAENLSVLGFPAFQPPLFCVGFAVYFKECQQLPEKPVARQLERCHRTLEPFEKIRPDKTNDLFLPPFFEGVYALICALTPPPTWLRSYKGLPFDLILRSRLRLTMKISPSASPRTSGALSENLEIEQLLRPQLVEGDGIPTAKWH